MKFILEIPDDSIKDMQEFAADNWELYDASPEDAIIACFAMEGNRGDECDVRDNLTLTRIEEEKEAARTATDVVKSLMAKPTSFPQYMQKLKRKKIGWGHQHAGEMLHAAIQSGHIKRIEPRNWSLAVKYVVTGDDPKKANGEAQG